MYAIRSYYGWEVDGDRWHWLTPVPTAFAGVTDLASLLAHWSAAEGVV